MMNRKRVFYCVVGNGQSSIVKGKLVGSKIRLTRLILSICTGLGLGSPPN